MVLYVRMLGSVAAQWPRTHPYTHKQRGSKSNGFYGHERIARFESCLFACLFVYLAELKPSL